LIINVVDSLIETPWLSYGQGEMRIGVKPGQWGWSFDELVSSWQAAEEAGFAVVSCFDHVSTAPAGLAAWDAPSLLTAMAGTTARIALRVDVLNVLLRHPFLLGGQLAVAQAASGGRLEVGLGAGSSHLARYDHAALGLPFPPLAQRRERLARCLQAFPALWRGEAVTDPELGMEGAALGPLGIEPPPLFVGGRGEGTMRLAAAFGDGWNGVEADAKTYATLVARVERLCQAVGRARPLRKATQVFVRDIALGQARTLVRDLEQAGAEEVTFVLVGERGPQAVRELAAAVL
jgi:alkanesulfonate monooxygenase SsuD/methylene tetrahydromethanopterin reductase-like flavin-dependent oxidoreductase (luciferase family)